MTFLAGRVGRRVRRFVVLPTRALRHLRHKTPERLLIAPQDIRTSDPTIATDIAAGYFAFGGRIVNAHGRSPFALDPASDAWSLQLAGFGWLRHLRAADSEVARHRGRALVDDFLSVYPRPSTGLAWEPRTNARRMLSWLSQSPVILQGADGDFYGRFIKALAAHRGLLDRQIQSELAGEARLLAAVALAEYSLCVPGGQSVQRRSTEVLAAEIGRQVLPDGGHISRNPQALIDLLLDLLPLRQAYAARGIQAPPQLLNAIDRMMPMLRLFRHGDGSLALFNGMGLTAPELVATILAYDDARAQPLTNALYAGYQRIEHGATLVVVDSGASPPKAFSGQAHAGCLSFELSSGFRRLVVNCGAPDGTRAMAREAARSTAAHSTLVIDDTSSCRFATNTSLERWLGDQILGGPVEVTVERRQTDEATTLIMTHDGYGARFGCRHRRTLSLARDGRRLDGRDSLEDMGRRKLGSRPYALRFHLHPAVRARNGANHTVTIDTPDGEAWCFDCESPPVIEPSILFAASGGPRASTQIKIAANAGDRREIAWSFQRLSAAAAGR